MAYTPKTWECGDVVTAEALNHIEQGIANSGGGAVVARVASVADDGLVFDKTWQNLKDAIDNGNMVMTIVPIDPLGNALMIYYLGSIGVSGGNYGVQVFTANDTTMVMTASDPDEYLTYNYEEEQGE